MGNDSGRVMTVQMITQLTRANAAEFVAAAETALAVANLRWRYLRLWEPAWQPDEVWAGPFLGAAGVEWARGRTPQELHVDLLRYLSLPPESATAGSAQNYGASDSSE